MISDSRLCTKCNTKHNCNICGKIYPSKDFPDSQLHNKGDPDRNIFLRCTKCHTCTECNEEKDIHAFDGNSPTCRKCQKLAHRHTWDACQRQRAETAFNVNILDNARKHDRKRVCIDCCNKGMSPKDVRKYRCDECGDRGHLKFPYEARRQYIQSNGRTKIVCSDCTAKQTRIEKRLRQTKSWKCKCPGTGLDRTHNPQNIKCDLFESQMGQRRLPGGNNTVSEDEWHFVERMRKRRNK